MNIADFADTDILTPTEVAAIFKVDPKTVARWASDGKLSTFRTPGGHRRYSALEVRKLLGGTRKERTDD